MRMGMSFIFGSLLFCMIGGVGAQDVPAPPKPPLFGSLFAQPTGLNGYEDWVQTGDVIRNLFSYMFNSRTDGWMRPSTPSQKVCR